MKRTEFSIEGMHCASCAALINKGLQKAQGVSKANVNYASAKATVDFDEKITNEEKLIEVIKSRGYSATVGTDREREKKLREAEILKLKKLLTIGVILSVPALIVGMLLMEIPYRMEILLILATPVQFIVGKEFYLGAWSALKNKTANMDTLIAVGTSAAYFYSVFAVFGLTSEQYFETSATLITLVILGKYLEAVAKGKTSDAIRKLMNLAPKTATVVRNSKEVEISLEEVVVGDTVIVKPGEKIAVDGTIVEGQSAVDESMISGESMPVEKTVGSVVIGGSINKHGSFKFVAKKIGSETVLAQIVKLVEEAQGSKAEIQRFADSVSSIFVPIVIGIAIVAFSLWYFVFGQSISFSLIIGVSILVIACPCALGLATPTAIMVGTGIGAQRGILIKNAQALETMHKINAIVFDKTGTITQGKPKVTDFLAFDDKQKKQILDIALTIESKSEHPLADAIMDYAKENGAKNLRISDFKAIAGKGVVAKIEDQKVYLGKVEESEDSKIASKYQDEGKTAMILKIGEKTAAMFAVADTLRTNSIEAVNEIKKMGIDPYLITGDNEKTAMAIARKCSIEKVFANVMPQDKARYVSELQKKGMKVIMVGDGINDAPALAQADIGIAVGSGTDVAMESGSIVLMKNDPMDIARAIKLGRATMDKIKQNMFWALIYNVLGIPIAAGILYPTYGILLSPIIAGGAMAFSSVSVVLSALMLRRIKL